MPPLRRRDFLALAAGTASAVALGCGAGRGEGDPSVSAERRPTPGGHARGRLAARPVVPTGALARPGSEPLGLGSERDGVIYAPDGYRSDTPAPLAVMFHGAGGNARSSLPRLRRLADEHRMLLLAVDARASTWDAVVGRYGTDVAYIDAALERVFARYAVDPSRVAAEGFSDGASYALGLALTNGDLFTHAIAFSPGSVPLLERHGSPAVFVSHGTDDEILPIELCSRRIVPELRRRRYAVEYVEFEGPHVVPPEIAARAMRWFLS